MWKTIGKNCCWGHPSAPSVRWLWEESATEAVLEPPGDTRVGNRTATRVIEIREEDQVLEDEEGEWGGPDLP